MSLKVPNKESFGLEAFNSDISELPPSMSQPYSNIQWVDIDDQQGEEEVQQAQQKEDMSSQIWVQDPSFDAGDPFGILGKAQKAQKVKSDKDEKPTTKVSQLTVSYCKQNNQEQSEVSDFEVEEMKSQLFPELKERTSIDEKAIDVDEQTNIFTENSKFQAPSLNVDLIKRQIRRQQRLDIERMKKEKQDMKQLLQLQPARRHTQKMQKRQKVVSKRTLELLAKKFDEFYSYEQNPDYKGPKMSLRQIGLTFDIGPNTIHKLYTEWMDDPTFYDRIVHFDLNRRIPQRKLTLQRLQHIARLIKENPFLTQNEITVELNRIDDLKSYKDGQKQEICKSTVARLLKVGKFRKKRVRCIPKEKNTTKSLQIRYDYCVRYKQLIDRKAKIYFLDESGFNLYMTREKAWARPNQQITVNCPISKGKRFSLIAIIGQEGVANWRIIQGTYRKYEYLEFLLEIFKRIYELNEEVDREKWLVMDNCAIHDKEQTFKMAKEWGVNVMFLPAYSPQLNPIEMWFHEVKTRVRKVNYTGERQLMEVMQRILKDYEDHDFSAYYFGTLKYIEKGLRKQKY